MKILLIDPPFYRILGFYNRYFPIGVTTVGTFLSQSGYDVVVYDCDCNYDPQYMDYSLLPQFYQEYLDSFKNHSHPVCSEDGKGKPDVAPFFTIAVPTYDRPELLRQCLLSILGQTFADFEVIVGNDYTKETVCSELLGIEDPRIRFINNPHNLGEVGNMNSLLGMSRGRYFTWQFDDDLYTPDFLEAVHSTLTRLDFPRCVYTAYSYIWGTSFVNVAKRASWTSKLLSGRQFLRMYLSGKLDVLGCCGVFETECLKQMGGVEKLCEHSIGAHSEHFILVRTGLLDQVAYINEPLVLYRNYESSWSYKTKEAEVYKQAGLNFVRESIKVLSEPALRDDFQQNLSGIFDLSLNIVIGKMIARDGYLDKQQLREYIFSLKEQLGVIQESVLYEIAIACLEQAANQNRNLAAIKARFKASAPYFLVKLAQMARARVSRCR